MVTSKLKFAKPATTYDRQVEILQGRGMRIDDVEKAKFYLQHLNYYRIAAYWLPFEQDHSTHKFKDGTTFEEALNLYTFDRELRLLVLDAIERIEVSMRANWAYHVSHDHGPHAHLDPNLHDRKYWGEDKASLTEEVKRAEEVFIKHMLETYEEELPPIWAACEVMSIGHLSRWYVNFQDGKTKTKVADVYNMDQMVLESWLHHFGEVRNICAHHGRLWNRNFKITPMCPRKRPQAIVGYFIPGSNKLHNTLVMLTHFMNIISPGNHWRQKIIELAIVHAIPLKAMGFTNDGLNRPAWQ